MSGTKPEDDELEQLLADSADLRRRYRASSSLEEPPPALDAAIRAAARREVHARPRGTGSPLGGSWRVPLSIAAVVVLSATVTLMVVEHNSYVPTAEQRTVPMAARAPEAPPPLTEATPPPPLAKKRTENAAVDAPVPPGAAPPALQDMRRETRRDAREKLATPATKSLPAHEGDRYEVQPFPAQDKADTPPPSAPAAGNVSSVRSGEVASTGAMVPGKQEQRRQASAEKQEAPKDEDSRARLAQPSSSAESKAKDSAPLREAPLLPASPGPPAPEKSTAGVAAPPVQGVEEGARARSFESNQTRALARREAESYDLLHAEADAPWARDPQAWLEHVKQLQTAGRVEEAKVSYKAFRSRYPDYRLPAGFVPPAP